MFTFDDLKNTVYFKQVVEEAYNEGKLEGILEAKSEAKLEAKLETVPLFLRLGLTVEQIAQELQIDIEIVQKFIEQSSDSGN